MTLDYALNWLARRVERVGDAFCAVTTAVSDRLDWWAMERRQRKRRRATS